ncbi:hypothetical protein [Pseudomonas sp. P1.31]|uniref:hypothetical protein n=1 Tax=Pseudomonas sp. P1.31 TaxID=1699311 RepID=UPI000A5A7A78|nr:hypothetical protein [Pseudomonas sp. P1.31]
MLVINPKRVNEEIEEKPYWYNYYAGYSHSFAKSIIETAGLNESSIILDPWNGAGTTTLMSSVIGHKSVGVDLNPVMKIIATAKQANRSDIGIIESKLLGLPAVRAKKERADDPLFLWFRDSGVTAIRRVERAIVKSSKFVSVSAKVESLEASECVLYTALFNCVRTYLKDFIPSNPTWIKKPKNDDDKVDVGWKEFKARYTSLVLDMLNGLRVEEHIWPADRALVNVASSTRLPLPNDHVDLVLTSPPYCTRIDYGVATLPELAVISIIGTSDIDDVRRSLMGTTTVPKKVDAPTAGEVGELCFKFLEDVKAHSSKASGTYYYKNLLQYFTGLSRSILEVSRVMRPNASFVCVVQDSFYKDLHCDLPSMIVELGGMAGLKLDQRHDFVSKQNMVNLNARSKSYRKETTAYECVLIFVK